LLKSFFKKNMNLNHIINNPNLISDFTFLNKKILKFNLSNFKYYDTLNYDRTNFVFSTSLEYINLQQNIFKILDNIPFNKFKFFFFKKLIVKKNFFDFYLKNSYITFIIFHDFKIMKNYNFSIFTGVKNNI